MPTLQLTVGFRLAAARRQAHIKAQDMASFLGVDASTLSRWENGKAEVPPYAVRLYSARTGVPIDELDPDGLVIPPDRRSACSPKAA